MESIRANKLQLTLSKVFNFIWYGWLGVSALTIASMIAFLVIVLGEFDLKIPTQHLTINDYQYNFNTKYLEILRTEGIVQRFIGKEMGWDLMNGNYWGEGYESLYPEYKTVKKFWRQYYAENGWNNNFEINLLHEGIYLDRNTILLKMKPQILFGIFLLPVLFIFFGSIILYSIRKIFLSLPDFFQSENVERLKYISFFIITAEFAKNLVYYWLNIALSRSESYSISTNKGTYQLVELFNFGWIDINYSLLFIAIIIFLFSVIFKIGVQIKQENDLTI